MKKTDKKAITIRLENHTLELLVELAKKEDRTENAMAATIIKQYIENKKEEIVAI